MKYSNGSKTWMPIKDTKRFLQLGTYSAMAILEDEEGNVTIRVRGLPHELNINCENIQEAVDKFFTIAKALKSAEELEKF
ncbi:MAG: hypothetical protein GWN00_38305 [Aliifodinibius sp.]|nr:hypothetical protein [Fodinibius sp.]NIV16476.1 hypothetical protein [Fodinibius sp.]NIY30428.1 hypothetical protein [Fodinibius sp.]